MAKSAKLTVHSIMDKDTAEVVKLDLSTQIGKIKDAVAETVTKLNGDLSFASNEVNAWETLQSELKGLNLDLFADRLDLSTVGVPGLTSVSQYQAIVANSTANAKKALDEAKQIMDTNPDVKLKRALDEREAQAKADKIEAKKRVVTNMLEEQAGFNHNLEDKSRSDGRWAAWLSHVTKNLKSQAIGNARKGLPEGQKAKWGKCHSELEKLVASYLSKQGFKNGIKVGDVEVTEPSFNEIVEKLADEADPKLQWVDTSEPKAGSVQRFRKPGKGQATQPSQQRRNRDASFKTFFDKKNKGAEKPEEASPAEIAEFEAAMTSAEGEGENTLGSALEKAGVEAA